MLVANYCNTDSESEEVEKTPQKFIPVDLTPAIKPAKKENSCIVLNGFNKELQYNAKVSDMSCVEFGPSLPPSLQKIAPGQKNTFTGYIEDTYINPRVFEEQMISFLREGKVLDPSGQYWMFNTQLQSHEAPEEKKRKTGDERLPENDPSNIDGYLGTWTDLDARYSNAPKNDNDETPVIEESLVDVGKVQGVESEEKKVQNLVSIWHGSESDRDTNWAEAPRSLVFEANSRTNQFIEVINPDVMKLLRDNGMDEGPNHEKLAELQSVKKLNLIPKKNVFTWKNASKGISCIRFYPRYGHLLLASSMDNVVRIYETYGKRRCRMDYLGHRHAVRDLDWHPNGTSFLTCSCDRTVKLWDVVTGKVLQTFSNEKTMPNVAKFYPRNPNIFLVGQSDKKILQRDIRSNDIVQEYRRHLGSINTITWIDDARRFVSTSDDKSIRVWEYNVPVDIKYIADPKMHSISSVVLHPNNKYFLCQSLDNQITVYSTREKYKIYLSKKFKGHLIAGYKCGISISPDGRCITSGDSHGNIFFWDWKTTKILKKVPAHHGVSIDVQWHPLDASKLASASWNGEVKLWD